MSLPYSYHSARALDLLVRGKQLLSSLRVVQESTANAEVQAIMEEAEAFIIDTLSDLDEATNALFATPDRMDSGPAVYLVEDLADVEGHTSLEMEQAARVARLRHLVNLAFVAVKRFQTKSAMARHHRLVLALEDAEL